MQTATAIDSKTTVEARPAATVQAKAAPRLAYINTLRVLLIVLVIMLHTAVTYGSVGDWTFKDQVNDGLTGGLLSLFTIACQAFFMGLFFFISGYFTPGSYERKGALVYWKDRLLRLALPLVIYTFFLQRLPNYLDDLRWGETTASFWQYCIQKFWTDLDAGPTWFLFALLLFAAGYTLWRIISKFIASKAPATKIPVPGKATLIGFGLLIGAIMLLVAQVSPLGEAGKVFGAISMQWVFFPQYILLFAAGIVAYRNDWLNQLSGKSLRFWTWMSVAGLVALPVIFVLGGAMDGKLDAFGSGFAWQAIVINLWIGFVCIAFSMALTLWLRERHPAQSPLMASASASAFTAYWIHPLILVALSYGMSYTSIHPLLKFVIVAALAVTLSFAISEPIRRLPGLKHIL
jgi:glucans biosynthesis protein C